MGWWADLNRGLNYLSFGRDTSYTPLTQAELERRVAERDAREKRRDPPGKVQDGPTVRTGGR